MKWLVFLFLLLPVELMGQEEIRIRWDRLLWAISMVESGGNDSAYNPKERATGRYQIRPIYLQDATQKLGETLCLEDMRQKELAEKVIRAYMARYKATTEEEVARKHNGGPTGHKKSATIQYWKKVQYWMEKYPSS